MSCLKFLGCALPDPGVLIGLAAFVLATLPLSLPSHAWVQAIHPQLSDKPRNVRFVIMILPKDGHCLAGVIQKPVGPNQGAYCSLTINECLGIPATIHQNPRVRQTQRLAPWASAATRQAD
jgi:hypothetical protein